MPKILVLIPIVTENLVEETEKYFKKHASEDFEISVTNLKFGPASIETYYDDEIAALFIVKEVEKAEKAGYDAVIIDCFDDPGLDAVREAVSIPVVGPGEASIYLACMLGEKFSILTVGPPYIKRLPTPRIRRMGLASRFASEISVGVEVLNIEKDRERTFNLLVEAGRRAIEEDGADVLILGCTGLVGYAEDLQKELKVPVIYPGLVALKIAETLVRLNLRHSKKAYPKPLPKKRIYPKGIE
mgnify:CR=1 FL=1